MILFILQSKQNIWVVTKLVTKNQASLLYRSPLVLSEFRLQFTLDNFRLEHGICNIRSPTPD
jgi:hypothetical protein